MVAPRGALLGQASAFLAAAALLRYGTRWRPARTAATGHGVLGDSLRGLRSLFGDRRIAALLLLWWIPPAFAVAPEALAMPYTHAAGAGTTGLGLFMAAGPVDVVAGELTAGLLPIRLRSRLVPILAGCQLLPLLIFALRPGLPAALAPLLATGLCSAYLIGLDRWLLAAVPDPLQGRAMAANSAGLMLLQGLGMAAAGAAIPPHLVIAGAGLLGASAVLGVLTLVRRTAPRRVPTGALPR